MYHVVEGTKALACAPIAHFENLNFCLFLWRYRSHLQLTKHTAVVIHNKLGNAKKIQNEMLTLWGDPMILNNEY